MAALSYEQFFGTGSQTLFTFTFEYLSRSHVKASVNGVEVPFNWAGTYTAQLLTPAPNGSVVEVRRTTPRDKRLVRFTDGSTLVATDMNTSTLQAFFLAQEAFDQGAASMAVTEDGSYSAQTRRITLLGDPVNNTDAVTKRWAETAMTSQLTLAVAARALAQTAQAASEAAQAIATTERQAAQQARTDAQAARDSASGHRLNAQNALTATEAARDMTFTARDVTLDARDVAVAAKDVTVTNRNEAQVFRNQAEQFAAISDGATKLVKTENLNDLPNKATARTNLGLGTAATKNITISTAAPSGGVDGDIWFQYN